MSVDFQNVKLINAIKPSSTAQCSPVMHPTGEGLPVFDHSLLSCSFGGGGGGLGPCASYDRDPLMAE